MKGHKIQGVLGILLLIVAIAAIWGWETYGREEFLYSDVIVLREEVQENTIITAEMLGQVKMDDYLIDPQFIQREDLDQVIGKAAKHYIPAGTTLVAEYFDDAEMILGDDQYIFSVPNSWIVSHPQTLRRMDTVYFYPVIDGLYGDEISFEEPAVCSALVAYAKNTSNQEVESVDDERLTGTSNVSMVEIVTTMETMKTMSQYIKEGRKFIVLYQ